MEVEVVMACGSVEKHKDDLMPRILDVCNDDNLDFFLQ